MTILLVAGSTWLGRAAATGSASPFHHDGVAASRLASVDGPLAYTEVSSSANVIGFGGAMSQRSPVVPAAPAVGTMPTPDGQGVWIVCADGGVFTFGDAGFYGSTGNVALNKPIVGMAPTPDAHGYWLVASDGGIFTFGDAAFYGSTGNIALNKPIVGATATADGHGYWLVASDGGVFTFGDAAFYGSTGSMVLNKPVVGGFATPDGHGYSLVASDGGIFTFGDAPFFGSTGSLVLNKPIVAASPTPDGHGYWLVASDGGIFTFGDAPFFGSAANLGQPVVGMAFQVSGGHYQNPLWAVSGLRPERVDQGVDYAGGGPIYPIGNGVVLNTTNSGWPGGAFISYKLSDGPAAGDIVYVAENVAPQVNVNQQVTQNTVLGTLRNAYPNLEIGWAAPPGNGNTAAMQAGQWSSYDDAHSYPTAYGENFSQLVAMLGGPAGINYGPVQGSLPAGWPSW